MNDLPRSFGVEQPNAPTRARHATVVE